MKADKIKLFVDAHSLDTGFQGTRTFIRELYTSLLNNYPDLDIYWGIENADHIKAIFPSVKPENILLYKKRKLSGLRFVFDIPAYIKQYQFDYSHFQYLSPLQQAGCQYIVTTHDVLFNDFTDSFSYTYRAIRNVLFGYSIKNAAIKTTVSTYSKQRIAHHYNIAGEEINVINNGVNKPGICKEAAREFIKRKFGISNFVLYVSRIEPRKNHLALLNSYLKLELYKQHIPLVFIGQESQPVKGLQSAINNLTDEQKSFFHWFPQVEQHDIEAFYSSCRVFVYPSRAEGFGIPPLEAAICEVPVLCSSATAMSEYGFFEPFMFNPADVDDLDLKLRSILSHPPSDAKLKNIAEKVSMKYQWQQSAQIFYTRLIEGLQNSPVPCQSNHRIVHPNIIPSILQA